MGKYDGSKCLSCGEIFKAGDDVVVCPECGTPYHRACYEKEGRCINTELHEAGGTWQPEEGAAAGGEASDEPIRCSRCGQENPPTGLFCDRCGLPLRGGYTEPRPFNDQAGSRYGQQGGQQGQQQGQQWQQGQPRGMFGGFADPNAMRFNQDSDIDGVKLGDLARYVGKNQFSYLTNFIRFGKFGGKVSLNFSAFLFPQLYFFYRKMYFLGVIYLLLSSALMVPTVLYLSAAGVLPSISFVTEAYVTSNDFQMHLHLTSTLLMASRCISGVFANYWYYRLARKQINAIRGEAAGADEEQIRGTISRRGGVSMAAFLLAALVSYMLMIGVVFVMNRITVAG